MTYTTSTVAYCLQSLPCDERPAAYADCAAANECHDPYPETLEERLHPWRRVVWNNTLEIYDVSMESES